MITATRKTSDQASPFRAGFCWQDTYACNAFAEEVQSALDGQDLRYSRRQKLMKRADHFGIKRFDANLIIAMVQHRAQPLPQKVSATKKSRMPIVAAVIFTQSLIIAAVLWLIY